MAYVIISKCKQCGREFTQRSRNPTGRKYCSPECRNRGAANTRRRQAGYLAINVYPLATEAESEADNG